jgi:hypothetical protein
MSKIIYDVIQRFEVENGVPHLISTNIQVIKGGEDLLSLAISMLKKLSFYDKFEEKRTSQYIGYKLKNPTIKGTKRYQLVLAQRKDGLYISLPRVLVEQFLLFLHIEHEYKYYHVETYWVLPSNSELFLEEIAEDEGLSLGDKVIGYFHANYVEYELHPGLEERGICIRLNEDQLFPYTWQAHIKSREVLEEFISYFAKILMEQQ